MRLRHPFAFAAVLLATTFPVGAAVIVESYPFSSLNLAVADTGVPLNHGLNLDGVSAIVTITEVRISLDLVGSPGGSGWAGDMFVSLNHDFGSQTAILLNRAGVDGGNAFGHGFDGWNVTFQSGAVNGDIHLGQPAGPATKLTGIWQPDGRVDPLDVARPAQLGVFNGAAGSGDWTLTVADLAPGGTMALSGFTLTLIGEAPSVPEPENFAAFAGVALVGFALWRRVRR